MAPGILQNLENVSSFKFSTTPFKGGGGGGQHAFFVT